MFSKATEIAGFVAISIAIGNWARWEAGLLFGGLALLFIGSTIDDTVLLSKVQRAWGWVRYAWYKQLAKERGIEIEPIEIALRRSPHPRIKVDPEAEERAHRMARAREERGKRHNLTPALSRHEYAEDEDGLDRLA